MLSLSIIHIDIRYRLEFIVLIASFNLNLTRFNYDLSICYDVPNPHGHKGIVR